MSKRLQHTVGILSNLRGCHHKKTWLALLAHARATALLYKTSNAAWFEALSTSRPGGSLVLVTDTDQPRSTHGCAADFWRAGSWGCSRYNWRLQANCCQIDLSKTRLATKQSAKKYWKTNSFCISGTAKFFIHVMTTFTRTVWNYEKLNLLSSNFCG